MGVKLMTIISEIKLLGYDVYCWVLDNVKDVTHFTLRLFKIITLISAWNKEVSTYLEDKLKELRSSVEELKHNVKKLI